MEEDAITRVQLRSSHRGRISPPDLRFRVLLSTAPGSGGQSERRRLSRGGSAGSNGARRAARVGPRVHCLSNAPGRTGADPGGVCRVGTGAEARPSDCRVRRRRRPARSGARRLLWEEWTGYTRSSRKRPTLRGGSHPQVRLPSRETTRSPRRSTGGTGRRRGAGGPSRSWSPTFVELYDALRIHVFIYHGATSQRRSRHRASSACTSRDELHLGRAAALGSHPVTDPLWGNRAVRPVQHGWRSVSGQATTHRREAEALALLRVCPAIRDYSCGVCESACERSRLFACSASARQICRRSVGALRPSPASQLRAIACELGGEPQARAGDWDRALAWVLGLALARYDVRRALRSVDDALLEVLRGARGEVFKRLLGHPPRLPSLRIDHHGGNRSPGKAGGLYVVSHPRRHSLGRSRHSGRLRPAARRSSARSHPSLRK